MAYKLQSDMRRTDFASKAEALRQGQGWVAKDGGRILTAPDAQLAVLRDAKDGEYRKKWHTTTTEELIGRTDGGSGVVLYGNNLLLGTPERIEGALERGVTAIGAGKLDSNEFKNVLSGKNVNGGEIPVYEVDQLIKWEGFTPTGEYGILIPLEDAQSPASDQHTPSSLLENKRFIARVGGIPKAKEIVKAMEAAGYETLGDYAWGLNNVDLKEGPQGLLVVAGNHNNGLYGYYFLDRPGSFVWVAPEAPVAQNTDPTRLKTADDLEAIARKLRE